jgi:type I restriction enzyme R subunit
MIERMGENDKIVTRYMADNDFQGTAFPILAKEIFDTIRERAAEMRNQAASPES